MRWLFAGCCILVLGCASFRDAWNQDLLYLKMCSEARQVWKQCRDSYAGQSDYPKDFALGFQDGYIAVSLGANGCPPTLPRQEYWHPDLRSEAGKARIAAWYNGYAAGAYTALSTGVQDRNRLPTASDIYGRHYSTSRPAYEAPATLEELLPPQPETRLPAIPPAESTPAAPSPEAARRLTPATSPNLTATDEDWDESVGTAKLAGPELEAAPELPPLPPGLLPEEPESSPVSGEFGLSRPE
jgi:hypothetical protein